jgi:glutamate synthase (ferredoxin)
MTGGTVVVLGETGRNFAAGMSGGIAYVLDGDGAFRRRCNTEMVALEQLDEQDLGVLKEMIERHGELTGSARATDILMNWRTYTRKFIKVMPMDYKRVLQALTRAKAAGLSGDEAQAAAFAENATHDAH